MSSRYISFALVPFLLATLLGLASRPGFAQQKQQAKRMSMPRLLERIKSNDANGDGKITKDEASPQLSRMFGRIDTSGDGVIDEKELTAFGQQLGRQLQQRKKVAAAQRKKQPPIRVPDGVTLETNIAYRDGSEKWKLDLAMPQEKGDAPRPAIVFVHGGGWRSGDKGGGQWRSLPLDYAAKGYVCISVNYRLVDEAVFPACVEDVKCAVRWLRANAEKYNVDSKRVGAYGNSAGAHLVAMLGLAGPDAQLEGDGPYQDQSSLVQAVCCSATPTDFSNWGGRGRSSRASPTLLDGPPEQLDERRRKASPITYVNGDAPPFLIVHGTADTTVPFSQGERLAKALQDAGAKDVTFLKFEDAGHGVFGQHKNETYPAMEKFFARTLRRRSAGN